MITSNDEYSYEHKLCNNSPSSVRRPFVAQISEIFGMVFTLSTAGQNSGISPAQPGRFPGGNHAAWVHYPASFATPKPIGPLRSKNEALVKKNSLPYPKGENDDSQSRFVRLRPAGHGKLASDDGTREDADPPGPFQNLRPVATDTNLHPSCNQASIGRFAFLSKLAAGMTYCNR